MKKKTDLQKLFEMYMEAKGYHVAKHIKVNKDVEGAPTTKEMYVEKLGNNVIMKFVFDRNGKFMYSREVECYGH